MAAFSRGLRPLILRRAPDFLCCSGCSVQFSTTATVQSGHSRWSKIKHDKGSADAKKNVQRSIFARDIVLASKLYGGDPNSNPRLATLLATAKKAGFPKASMEAAIARGQGKSTSGAALENVTLEIILPPAIAIIVECETDSKARTLQDLRHIVKFHGGSMTPTSYLFQKKGRVAFEKDERNIGVDELLDDAIEAGAEDVEIDEDGSLIIWTEPNKTLAAAQALQKSHGLTVESSDIIWDANEDTKVPLEEGNVVKILTSFLDQVQEATGVQGIYANVAQGSLADEVWEELQGKLNA